jgi:UDP-N-acetylglucosamine 2-epimerase (non-hydrolysing)
MTKDIAVVLGTRPEIIKLAGVIRELGDRARVIHTGQHYDETMSGVFLDELGIGEPDLILSGVGGRDRGEQIATMLESLTREFRANPPAAVIVQGDTNTVSAGAQAANYLGIPVIHVEAGLRSRDRAMPEELNRLVVGALADIHCAPTTHSRDNLVAEGIDPDHVLVTGNTVVEATLASLASAPDPAFMAKLPPEFVLATIHRPENTDTPDALHRVLQQLSELRLPVILPLHPRTRQAIDRFQLWHLLNDMIVIDPVGHADFLRLAAAATLLVGDSGGVQEECTVLKKPLVVVRRSTERPEAIEAGFAVLATPDQNITVLAEEMLERTAQHPLDTVASPYGDGTASAQIVSATLHAAYRDRPELPQAA